MESFVRNGFLSCAQHTLVYVRISTRKGKVMVVNRFIARTFHVIVTQFKNGHQIRNVYIAEDIREAMQLVKLAEGFGANCDIYAVTSDEQSKMLIYANIIPF